MTPSISISRVAVEHYESGLGIEHPSPRLSWRFAGSASDWLQKSYDLRVTRSTGTTEEYHFDTADSILVPWPSAPLRSRERVRVEVRSTGSDGSSTDWVTLGVEAGLLRREDWTCKMISNEPQPEDSIKRPFRLRRSFVAPTSTSHARLYITAHGLYEATLNGQRIGDEYLAPGWTDYNYHLNYRVFDVSQLLLPGQENILGAWVNEGWFAGAFGFRGGRRNIYGSRPGLFAQLEVDGQALIGTDDSWEWSYGPIVSSELYHGEVYDTKLDDPDWSTPEGTSKSSWRPAEIVDSPKASLVSSQAPPVRQVEAIKPVERIITPSGKTIIDFGQNFAGFVKILTEPSVAKGKIVLRHAEVLEHGELGTRPLRFAKATDTIILGGKLKGYQPKFTFHGFRYVEVTGWDDVGLSDLEGVLIHTDMERTGEFESSHALVNRLHKNVVYSTLSNTIAIPTDCPQRDERLGWTGDIQVFTPTMTYLFDTAGFLSGWLKDVYVNQKQLDGVVPVVVPNMINNVENLPYAIWGDVAVLTPYDLYKLYDDPEIVRTQYPSLTLWLDKGVLRDERTGLWSHDSPQLGDWLAPKADPHMPSIGPTDNYLVADAYLIHTTRVAAKAARLIGNDVDGKRYEKQASEMITSFHHEYVTPSGRVLSDTQTALSLILHFDIFDDSSAHLKALIRERLGALVTQDLWRVSTGFAGTPIILDTLAENDLLHHAYRMLQEKHCPSFLSPVLLGATTIWERWDSMLQDGTINPGEMTSFNHYALGAVATFLHEVVGGLRPLEPAWKKILVQPRPGGTIRSARTRYHSGYGWISCQWHIEQGKLHVEVEVPPNCTAQVVLPGVEEQVGSGQKSYTVDWVDDERWPPKVVQPPFCQPVTNHWVP
ncbi:bacterial alpha-L-rhamnosidase-domain-containing protein [Naematelia encephala]|uniref:alpha-L-rhamnosidase n=1 Tax=Naematelia encephala TaxID=71784 RepID=A0A1Y2APE5_9TREE|nr:bacterial alpha-L-rhamnosidase-domain-containing protein [Naematelia encephala]